MAATINELLNFLYPDPEIIEKKYREGKIEELKLQLFVSNNTWDGQKFKDTQSPLLEKYLEYKKPTSTLMKDRENSLYNEEKKRFDIKNESLLDAYDSALKKLEQKKEEDDFIVRKRKFIDDLRQLLDHNYRLKKALDEYNKYNNEKELTYEAYRIIENLIAIYAHEEQEAKLNKGFRLARDAFAIFVSLGLAFGESMVASSGMAGAITGQDGVFHGLYASHALTYILIVYTLTSCLYSNFFLIKKDVQEETSNLFGAYAGDEKRSFLPESTGRKVLLLLFGFLSLGAGACYWGLSRNSALKMSSLDLYGHHPFGFEHIGFFNQVIPTATGIGIAYLFFSAGASMLREPESIQKKIKENPMQTVLTLAVAAGACALQFGEMKKGLSTVSFIEHWSKTYDGAASLAAGLNFTVCTIFNFVNLMNAVDKVNASFSPEEKGKDKLLKVGKLIGLSLLSLLLTPVAPLFWAYRKISPQKNENSCGKKAQSLLTQHADFLFSSSTHANAVGQALLFSSMMFQSGEIGLGVLAFTLTYLFSAVPNILAMLGELNHCKNAQLDSLQHAAESAPAPAA